MKQHINSSISRAEKTPKRQNIRNECLRYFSCVRNCYSKRINKSPSANFSIFFSLLRLIALQSFGDWYVCYVRCVCICFFSTCTRFGIYSTSFIYSMVLILQAIANFLFLFFSFWSVRDFYSIKCGNLCFNKFNRFVCDSPSQ